ncbi:hypothetical protein LIER_09402 [Lithospermum erythrorhizon]|uniref:NAB domain-containing protein n=1 Tax=Lithospermum erythrorhizon TaxID=34254 RepID=A0AAV3PFK6_LITER
MLELIEEDDADSFAKHAEMYDNKFHRAHRSLAERYQLIMNKKNPSYCDILPKTSTITSSSSSSEDDDIKSYPDSISTTSKSEAATLAASDSINIDHGEVMVVRKEEMESLVDENKKLKEQLMQKDEEKREVIRQVCFSLDFLRNENEDLMAMMRKNGYDHITHDNELNVLEQKKISC